MNFPHDRKVCPVCGGDLWQAAEEDYDADWRAQATDLKTRRTWMEDRDACLPLPNAALDAQHIIEYQGRSFVADPTMEKFGYPCIEAGDVVQVNGEFFEVMGAKFPDTDEKGWWLDPVPPLEWPRMMAVMSPEDYHQLDVARGLRV